MAFFTRVNLTVPVLPPEDVGTDGTSCPAPSSHAHRRHSSEPVTSVHGVAGSTTRPNSVPGASVTFAARNGGAVTDRSTDAIVKSVEDGTTTASNASDKLTTNTTENETSEARGQTKDKSAAEKPDEKNGNEEPKRYEYVVDRVLGVEV